MRGEMVMEIMDGDDVDGGGRRASINGDGDLTCGDGMMLCGVSSMSLIT
jgi:hypothetical protein